MPIQTHKNTGRYSRWNVRDFCRSTETQTRMSGALPSKPSEETRSLDVSNGYWWRLNINHFMGLYHRFSFLGELSPVTSHCLNSHSKEPELSSVWTHNAVCCEVAVDCCLTRMELVTLECPLAGDCLDRSGESFWNATENRKWSSDLWADVTEVTRGWRSERKLTSQDRDWLR